MKRALLLLNMGGPNNLDEVELFLKNMFNDKRIIAAPKPIRQIIAKFITFKRKSEARANYKQLGGKSPIIGYTQELVKKLEEQIDASVHMVMRYTPPFAHDVMQDLKDYDELYAIPLYPHYSTTTTASSMDHLYEAMAQYGIKDKLKTIEHYYADKAYNQAIVARIKDALEGEKAQEYELIFSAHGLPKKIIEKGDLYQKHIRRNVYYARKALLQEGICFHKTHLAYQSRLGPMEWIRPYLEDKLRSLEKKCVIIYPIAFTVDNSETEFELDVEYKEFAQEIGIKEYRVAKAPNAHPHFIEALVNIYTQMKEGV